MKHLRITVEGKSYEVTVERLDTAESQPAASAVRPSPAAHVAAPKAAPKAAKAAGDVTSPLAGIVKSLDVAIGTQVKAGDLVVTLEAMKMFTAINAPTDGTVTAFHINVGDAVDEDQPLYTLS
jgi:biotin carboxyl carrier protein